MTPNLPLYISILFLLTTLASMSVLIVAVAQSSYATYINGFIIGIAAWAMIQAVLALSGFYLVADTAPPRFILALGPPIVLVILVFLIPAGRQFIDTLSLTTLTYGHVVRIPVEIVLYYLFLHKFVPELITFSGRNFDILSGITAPFIAYYGLQKGMLGKRFIILWNVLALCLLINIVITAVLSAPFRFQHFAFDQPNVALFYFPFIWLPSIVVPMALFSHLVSLRQLIAGPGNH